MARKKKQAVENRAIEGMQPYTPNKVFSSTKEPAPQIPTYDQRHTTAIRLGKISGEIFCQKPERRKELGLRPFPTMESDFIDELRR